MEHLEQTLPDRSIIIACDFDGVRFEEIVRLTAAIPAVGGYKIGAALALGAGLGRIARIAREFTDKPLIYDHQKAGTDIPDTAPHFMATLRASGVAGVILFPFAGPITQRAWTDAARNEDLDVIVGGYMTHPSFLSTNNGYVPHEAVLRIYDNAARSGVRQFVVPGNDAEAVASLRDVIAQEVHEPIFYAPGFGAQGGDVAAITTVLGPRWHAIVGRSIYLDQDPVKAIRSLAAHLYA